MVTCCADFAKVLHQCSTLCDVGGDISTALEEYTTHLSMSRFYHFAFILSCLNILDNFENFRLTDDERSLDNGASDFDTGKLEELEGDKCDIVNYYF